ncbi:MAG: hypothetical protein M3P50_07835 [Actinomycetota bacterium]|nr:hypothetical protein [Actinomycetota bacterium]
MRRFLRENGLSLAFGGLFLGSIAGQAVAGMADFNERQVAHRDEPLGLATYLSSSEFWVDVMENWQSEYLQFTLYILGTIWLLQRGSSESKEPDMAGRESEERQRIGRHARPDSPRWAAAGGWRTTLYSNSLLLVMGAIWLATWASQSITGRIAYNAEQIDHLERAVGWGEYVRSADFWNRTLQNWQSEFLAVGSLAILAVYLRQRGSPESKLVGAAHDDTGLIG